MQPTWTFARDGQYLVLRRIEDADGVSLQIISPEGTRTIVFHDASALVVFQADMEALLVRTGWSLESFSPEQRQAGDRRLFPREDPDRRRWWTDGRRASVERRAPDQPTRRGRPR